MRRARWEEVVEYQAAGWQLATKLEGRKFLEGFQADRAQRYGDGYQGALPALVTETLHRAEPVYVADEMKAVAETAAESFDLEPLLESDLITPFGFAMLPSAYVTTDVNGYELPWRSVAWMPDTVESKGRTIQGVWYMLFTHHGDEATMPPERRIQNHPHSPLLMHCAFWPFGENVAEFFATEEDTTLERFDGMKRTTVFVQVLWRLMAQYVRKSKRYAVSRPTARAVARIGHPARDVTVVRLRRERSPASDEDGKGSVEYSHRWVVRGFWRDQWYPSLDAHRQIYIADYIKGPDDKPLVINDRVFELVR